MKTVLVSVFSFCRAFISRRRRKKMASGGGTSSKEKKGFSVNRKDYKLMEEVGNGASAVVHLAIYLPTKEVIAIKCLDLDRCNTNLVPFLNPSSVLFFLSSFYLGLLVFDDGFNLKLMYLFSVG